ncbi:hypothetical protein B0H10DRAFT_2201491 [Mycena sp. CBHHK59/15]|nr:hypothetical protein B0H10DRAFT_2201491 [Mycena sp. CBHHK59/15]
MDVTESSPCPIARCRPPGPHARAEIHRRHDKVPVPLAKLEQDRRLHTPHILRNPSRQRRVPKLLLPLMAYLVPQTPQALRDAVSQTRIVRIRIGLRDDAGEPLGIIGSTGGGSAPASAAVSGWSKRPATDRAVMTRSPRRRLPGAPARGVRTDLGLLARPELRAADVELEASGGHGSLRQARGRTSSAKGRSVAGTRAGWEEK